MFPGTSKATKEKVCVFVFDKDSNLKDVPKNMKEQLLDIYRRDAKKLRTYILHYLFK